MKTNNTSAFRLALIAFVCTTLVTTSLHAQTPVSDNLPATPQPQSSLRTGIWPTSDGMSVRVNFEHRGRGAVYIRLYNSKGVELYDQREFGRTFAGKFDLSTLPAGVYTIDLQSADTHVSQAISINAPKPAPARIALINTADYFVTSK